MTLNFKRLTEYSFILSIPLLLIDTFITNQFHIEGVFGFIILYSCLYFLMHRNTQLPKWIIILLCFGMFALSIFNFGWLFVIWLGYGFTDHNIHFVWYCAILINLVMFVYAIKKVVLGEFETM